jgi:hypothetical protein
MAYELDASTLSRVGVGSELHDPGVANLFRLDSHLQGDGELRRTADRERLHQGIREACIGVEINEEGMRKYATHGMPFFE